MVGIIGRNGAGKSTLLKILSPHHRADRRAASSIRGRVGSLLEVGTGFHPELTGRENIYLNGAILGMTPRARSRRKFDEIVAFAEVEQFLDTPVKRYSSGMYVRLAFAVAAHLEPEILIVDEVLAVGDAAFQTQVPRQDERRGRQRAHRAVRQPQHAGGGRPHQARHPAGRRPRRRYWTDRRGDPDLPRQPCFAGRDVRGGAPAGDRPQFTRVALRTSGPGPLQQHGEPLAIDIDIFTPEPIPTAAVCPDLHRHARAGAARAEPGRRGSDAARARPPPADLHLSQAAALPGPLLPVVLFRGERAAPSVRRSGPNCPFEVVNITSVREFYWYPDDALYVEEVGWRAEALDAPQDHAPTRDPWAGHPWLRTPGPTSKPASRDSTTPVSPEAARLRPSQCIEAAIELIAEWARKAPRRMLEIGCGVGATSWRMARAWPDAQVVGSDISPQSVAVAADCFQRPNLTYVVGPLAEGACRTRLRPRRDDGVYEHIHPADRADLHAAIGDSWWPTRVSC